MEVENKASGNSGDRFEVNMGAMMGRSKRFFSLGQIFVSEKASGSVN